MKFDATQFSWFDLVVIIVVLAGIIRGRKRGMSEELLDVFQWLLIVVVAALMYKTLGYFIASFTHVSLMVGYIAAYLFYLIMIKMLFSGIKKVVGEKLVQADTFGRLEYYLGMISGAVRYLCMLLVLMSLLHAKFISDAERAAQVKMQKDNFGAISFPTLASLQQTVFHESAFGAALSKQFAEQLIEPAAPGQVGPPREAIGRRRERAVEEVLDPKSK